VEYLRCYAQLGAAAVCLVLPGLWILRLATRGAALRWPPAFALAPAFLISSLLIAAGEFLAVTFLPAQAARWAARAVLLPAVVCAAGGGWRLLRDVFAPAGPWERRMWLMLGGCLLVWVGLMPLSPYPSQLSIGLGDRPAYYRLAANLAQGRGWLCDYFIADFAGGAMPYLATHPLPVLITAFLMQLAGVNGHALSIYGSLAGALHVGLLACFVGRSARAGAQGLASFAAAVLALAVPIYFYLLGVGETTVPGALAFLTAAAFLAERPVARPWILAVCGVAALFMLLVRPEAAMLAVLLSVGYPVLALLSGRAVPAVWRAALGAALLAAAVATWAALPRIVARVPEGLRNMSVFYLEYKPADGDFGLMYAPWWKINRDICTANLSNATNAPPGCNAAIGEEIRRHPVQFAEFLGRQLKAGAARSLQTVRVQSYMVWDNMNTAIAVLCIIFAFVEARNRILLAVILACMAALPLFNIAYSARHMLPYTPVLYALFARALLARGPWLWKRLGAAALTLVLGVNLVELTFIRRDWFNRWYEPAIADLRRIAAPDDVIATSYPQLISFEVDCATAGGSWLTENIEGVIARFAPDIILVDNLREGCQNYTLLKQRGGAVPGYETIRRDPDGRYAIFVTPAKAARLKTKAAEGPRP